MINTESVSLAGGSHQLFFEICRYKNPSIKRNERKCTICKVLEDGEHALFHLKHIKLVFSVKLQEGHIMN